MALVVKDRVKETTATTGQGTLTLAGAVSGFQSFTSALSDGDTTYYAIFETSTGEWEVGLGTFTASGTTLARTTILESSNAGSAINLTAGAADVFITQPAEKAVYLDASDNVTFADATITGDLTVDTNTLYVDSTNNRVGIGTSSPATQASVQNASTSLGLEIDTTSGFSSGPTLRGYYRAGSAYKPIAMTGSTVHFGINDVEKMRIDSSGRVGIGTSSPDANSGLTVESSTTSGQIMIKGNNGGNAGIALQASGQTTNFSIYENSSANLVFQKHATERMRIDSSGNLGIGTSTPPRPLSAQTGSNGASLLAYRNSETSGDYGGLEFHNHPSSITSYRKGAIYFRSDGTGFGRGDLLFCIDDAADSDNVSLSDEVMRIDSSGQVGIGTSSPSSALDVDQSQNAETNIELTNTNTGSSAQVRTKYTTDGGLFTVGKTSDAHAFGGDAYIYNVDNTNIRFATNDTERMRIDSSGQVGIGTTSPNAKLTLVRSGAGLLLNGDDGTVVTFIADTTGSVLTYGTFTSHPVAFKTNNGERMRIDSSGNVGIGQTSPGAKLDVNGVILGESLQGDYDALSGTSPAPDADNADAFSLTMTGNTTFTFGSVTSGRSVGFCLQLTGNGSTVTWPSSVDWAGGTAPDAPASGETDILVFWTRDGGTTWYGFLAGDAMA